MKLKKGLSYIFVTFLSLITIASCQNKVSYDELGERIEERTLNFYALNDFHGAYLYDEDYKQVGLSRIGNYLINEKNNNFDNTFIISSGDMFQGGAESNITYGEVVIETMNQIGFDSMTIGNHEFDWGEEKLEEMASKMDFPLLGINVFHASTNKRPYYLSSSTVINKEGINVGIIGSIMPGIEEDILATIADDFIYDESIELIKEEATYLRNEEKCEIVILSTHDGEYERYLELVDYIDALFLGHDHNLKSGYLDETNKKVPYIEGKNYGSYLSNISLDLKLNSNNEYEIISSSFNNISTWENKDSLFSTSSTLVDEVYDKYKEEIESIRDEVLYTFESNVSKGRFARFISYSLMNYATNNENINIPCDSGSINSGGIRSDIVKGEFTYGDLIKIYPFENTLCLMKFDPSMYNMFLNGQENVVRSNPPTSYKGKFYLATIDYVAYKNTSSLAEEIIETNILARDVVKETLKTIGYIEV